MKFHWKFLLLFFLSFYMLLSYQNCGQNPSLVPGLVSTNPNLSSIEFVAKISEDADLVLSNLTEEEKQSCEFVKPSCLDDENNKKEIQLACIEDTLISYYNSLQCAGFKIAQIGSCFAAISTQNPSAMEPVMLDLSCINQKTKAPTKSLHLGTCYGEEIGFNRDAPSTGMRISAWLELGNAYPYSRSTKQLVFYPNQSHIDLDLYQENANAQPIVDACGKSKRIEKIGPLFSIDMKEDSI